MYIRGGPPAVLVNRDPTARLLRARSRGGLGDTETETDCPQPVSTAERDALRDELDKYAGWGPGTYDQWHEGHPDLKIALDDIGGRMKGLYDRPKLLRCDAEARKRANEWIASLKVLLRGVKSSFNQGWDASGFTRVPATFTWSFYRGPTYTIRSTSDPSIARTMHDHCVKYWGEGACTDAPPGWAKLSGGGSAPPPTGPAPPSAPPGSVVVDGQIFRTSAEERASREGSGNGGESFTRTTPPTNGGSGTFTTGGGALPSIQLPSFLEGSIAGVPIKYLALGLVGYMLMKRR